MRVRTEESICAEGGVDRRCFDHVAALALRAAADK